MAASRSWFKPDHPYSGIVYLALLGAMLPAIVAINLTPTVDYLPYTVCIGASAALVWILRHSLRRLRHRIQNATWSATKHELDTQRAASGLSGHSEQHSAPGGFIVWLLPICWSIPLGLAANYGFDRSEPRAVETVIVTFARGQKGPRRVTIQDWRDGSTLRLACLSARSALCEHQPGTKMRLVVRNGALGWPWIEHAELAPSQALTGPR